MFVQSTEYLNISLESAVPTAKEFDLFVQVPSVMIHHYSKTVKLHAGAKPRDYTVSSAMYPKVWPLTR